MLKLEMSRHQVDNDSAMVASFDMKESTSAEVISSVNEISKPGMVQDGGCHGDTADINFVENEWTTVARKGSQKLIKITQKVIGCNKSASSGIKAAKQIQKKFIFHLDNVCSEMPCSEVVAFLADCKVEVLSCFTSKSWVNSSENDQDTCHAFRVCVKLDDKSRVLDGALWPQGVIVREWKFKKSSDNGSH